MEAKAFHFMGDQHLSASASVLEWSPKFDLVVMVAQDGAVSLHRSSSWQKIWEINPDFDRTGKAVCATWRPDSRVISVGYEKGIVRIYSLENVVLNGVPQGPSCIHEVELASQPSSVCLMEWFSENVELTDKQSVFRYVQSSDSLQPDVPNVAVNWMGGQQEVSCRREVGLDMKDCLLPDKALDVLVVGTADGRVRVLLGGVMTIVEHQLPNCGVPLDVSLSSDWSCLSVVTRTTSNDDPGDDSEWSQPCRHLYSVSAILENRAELASVCRLYGTNVSLCDYLSWSLQGVIDSWEDVMEQINSKLLTMSSELGGEDKDVQIGSVLLRLLTRGNLPWPATAFLERELSEGALMRVSGRLTTCYDTIRKTIIHSVQPVLFYLLARCQDGVGFAKFKYKFSSLGLQEEHFQAAVNSVAALTLKCSELITVMMKSAQDIALFLKWLQYATSIIQSKRSDSEDSQEITMSRSELCSVGKFIATSLCRPVDPDAVPSSTGEDGQQFSIEKVGQYLRNEPLTSPSQQSQSSYGLTDELRSLVGTFPWQYPHHSDTSVVQDYWAMTAAIRKAFQPVPSTFSELSRLQSSLVLPRIASRLDCSGYLKRPVGSSLAPLAISQSGFCQYAVHDHMISILRSTDVHTGVAIYFSTDLEDSGESVTYAIQDAQWYTEKKLARSHYTLTVLLSRPTVSTHLVQVDIDELLASHGVELDPSHRLVLSDEDISTGCTLLPTVNAFGLLSLCRDMESANIAGMAVGGDRQLSVVVSANCRYLKFFDMAQLEEDDDEDEEEDGGEDGGEEGEEEEEE